MALIEFENLVCGAGKGPPGQSELIPAKALTHLCRGFYGNASIRKAYADWANSGFGRYQPALANNGVDLVQIAHHGVVAGKDAVDIWTAVDAMDVLITHPDVDVFVLVAGDSDYSPLVHRLREFGKHVIGSAPTPPPANDSSRSARSTSSGTPSSPRSNRPPAHRSAPASAGVRYR